MLREMKKLTGAEDCFAMTPLLRGVDGDGHGTLDGVTAGLDLLEVPGDLLAVSQDLSNVEDGLGLDDVAVSVFGLLVDDVVDELLLDGLLGSFGHCWKFELAWVVLVLSGLSVMNTGPTLKLI